MKKISLILTIILFTLINVYGQTNRYNGVPNDVNILNMYWKNYQEEGKDMGTYVIVGKKDKIRDIRNSISRNIANYSLSEYCLIIDYLLEKLDSSELARGQWTHYMDSLQEFCKGKAHRAGVVPLEAQFFLATLNQNKDELNKKYPAGFEFAATHTPPMYEYGYKPENYEQIILESGFPSPEDKGIMYDLLLIEDKNILNVIKRNPELEKQYRMWLKNIVPSDLFEFHCSEDRAVEVLTRKKQYLRFIFTQQKDELSQYTAEQIDKIEIVHLHSVNKNANYIVLTGIWRGPFGNRNIEFTTVSDSDNLNPEHKLRGKSKFVGQNDRHLVEMTGSFVDMGDYIEVQMIEQPDTAQWNGVFTYTVERSTRKIKGTWESNNKKLKREYVLEKEAEED